MAKVEAKTAKRFRCASSVTPTCDRGNRAPTRRACSRCGSSLNVEHGVWGVFEWNSGDHYPRENAKQVSHSHAVAERAAGREFVVRFVTAKAGA